MASKSRLNVLRYFASCGRRMLAMVGVQDLLTILMLLQQKNQKAMQQLVQQFTHVLQTVAHTSRPSPEVTGTRGLGRPTTFKGEDTKYHEWMGAYLAYGVCQKIPPTRANTMLTSIMRKSNMIRSYSPSLSDIPKKTFITSTNRDDKSWIDVKIILRRKTTSDMAYTSDVNEIHS